jgi:hypothetical protein
MGWAQRAPEHTLIELQRGLKSSPYSQRRPSFVHAVPSSGSAAGHSGLFWLPEELELPELPELPLEDATSCVLPEHALADAPTITPPRDVTTSHRGMRRRRGRMVAGR